MTMLLKSQDPDIIWLPAARPFHTGGPPGILAASSIGSAEEKVNLREPCQPP
jgi:hypothetical protein